MYGFFARGNTNQLIIDDTRPVLTQCYWGDIITNRQVAQSTKWWTRTPSYGYCEVVYTQPIPTVMPPMVFAVPTPYANGSGLGNFCHRGTPGNWTGFSILVSRSIFMAEWWPLEVGYDSGWEYRVCAFGVAGDAGYDEYGMRIFGAPNQIIYDSAWPVVKFKGLLGSWTLDGFTRFYESGFYWGTRHATGDTDDVIAKGYHTWGAADWTQGLMISGLGKVWTAMDPGIGLDDVHISAVVMVGFAGASRARIEAVGVFGTAQHPGGSLAALNQWKLLLADFTAI